VSPSPGAGTLPGPDAAARDARVLVDLTGLPRPQRHRVVIATLEVVDPGVSLLIVDDHEAGGLRALLQRRYGARLGWDDMGRSGDRVAVSIRLGAPAGRDAGGGV
jgi:uncharacterized protein (DUF2249 family)